MNKERINKICATLMVVTGLVNKAFGMEVSEAIYEEMDLIDEEDLNWIMKHAEAYNPEFERRHRIMNEARDAFEGDQDAYEYAKLRIQGMSPEKAKRTILDDIRRQV